MGNLLTFNFWFNYYFVPLMPFWLYVFIAVVILFAAASIVFLFLKIKAKKKKKLWSELFDFSLSNLIVGSILLFVYYEEVRFFSARIWLVLWSAEILFWSFKLFKYARTFYIKREDLSAQDSFKKYLPK